MEARLTILFGSQTGTAKAAAQEVACRTLAALPQVRVECRALDDFDFQSLVDEQAVLFLVATTGFGSLPTNALQFWRKLTLPLPADCLEDLRFSVFGFGDSSYAQFNFAARLLHHRLVQRALDEVQQDARHVVDRGLYNAINHGLQTRHALQLKHTHCGGSDEMSVKRGLNLEES